MRSLFSLLVLLTSIAITCRAAPASERLTIFTVNYPLQFLAAKIAGPDDDVVLPAPTGIDPAFWAPDTETILAFQKADLILLNGADYAKWRKTAALPRARMLDTGSAYRGRLIESRASAVHGHGPTGKHAHSGTAFTTWLDLTNAQAQVKAISERLSKLRPERESGIERRADALRSTLGDLDRRLTKIGTGAGGQQPLLASHPVYQYLAHRYGFKIRSVQWEPDVFPSDEQWADLKRLLQRLPAKWMLWEAEPVTETKAKLATLGVGVIVFDQMGNRPESGDFLTGMTANINRMRDALGQ